MFSPRVEEILDELLELPAPERAARLEILCLEDDPIRREVASLLAAYEGAGSFLTPTLRGRLHPSDRIGRYRIVAEIGRGAMGIVYLAEDSDLGRNVALKTLTSAAAGDRQRRQRLHAEARMLAAVSQPNIAQVYSFEELPSESVDSVITMEYVPGSTLADKLRNASLSVESTIEFVRQIAAALEAAHAEGVVHRDLKPQNIRITPNGWVKVLDFGLAFHREREPGGAGFPCGTAGYMSPEQAAGVPVEPSTDLWSLGCILFECLTGRLPLTDRETLAEARTALSPVEAARLESLPTAVIELLDGLRRWNPVERPSATRSRRILEEELLRLRARALLHDPTGRPSQETESPPGRPGNLPRRLTEFVGRDRALSELDRVLREHRIVTLTGPGGTGKTRLAIERAKRSRDQYPGGTWFIDLSIVDVGSQVPATAAHALGVRDAPGDAADPIGSIARFLSGNAALVVVDNCEHVIDDVYRWVDEVLDRCPGVTVLATSRLPLGLAEERLFVVPPLRVPDGADSAALASSEAIQLFAARARSRHPSFQLHEDQIATIAAICRRADGLPLAIEIAAGHARTLAVPEILARFEANPLLLGTPARGAPARHRSLAGTVQWSYRLLGRSERLLLERLSAFRGSWTLEAAQSVCVREGLSEWQLLDLIARLVERSLVEVDSLDREQQARYRLLETIQRFAHDRLVRRTDEPEATEERYVAYYLEQVTPRSDEPEVNERWLARVDAERANLQQALSIAIRRGWYARAFSLAAHLTRYWVTAGLWREGGDTLRKLLELRESAAIRGEEGTSTIDPRDEIRVLGGAARLGAILNQQDQAFAAADRAVALARELGESSSLARALRDAGAAYWYAVRIDESESLFREALALSEDLGDQAAIAVCLGNVAAIKGARQKYAEALSLYERQLAINRHLQDRLGTAKSLFSLGRILERLGRPEEAIQPLLESLDVHRETRDLPGIALCLHNLGDACASLSRTGEARDHFLEALQLRLRLGNDYGVCSVLLSLIGLAESSGDWKTAAELLEGILHVVDALDIPMLPVQRQQIEVHRSEAERHLGSQEKEMILRGPRRDLPALAAWAAQHFATDVP